MLPLALLAVVWTAVSVVVSDLFGSAVIYGVAAAIFFVLVVGGAWLAIGRADDSEDEEDALDPMITGERGGLGYAVLNVVGGIIAVPFILYNSGLKMLDRLATVDESDETAIEAVDTDRQPAQTSGSD